MTVIDYQRVCEIMLNYTLVLDEPNLRRNLCKYWSKLRTESDAKYANSLNTLGFIRLVPKSPNPGLVHKLTKMFDF
jgi:hypothetical protein